MAEPLELTLRPKPDIKPIDLETAQRIGRVARAEKVELDDGGAVFRFAPSAGNTDAVRGNLELATRFELGAHWHTRYEVVGR